MKEWFFKAPENILGTIVSAVIFYFLIILICRLFGLRSFTSMSSFDFVITLSMGAMLATTIVSKEVTLTEGAVALMTLFGLQWLIAEIRVRNNKKIWVDTPPILLMDGPVLLRKNMRKARITENELISKLRAHNIRSYQQVQAVVFESSGNISVLYKPSTSEELDEVMLKGVNRD